MDMSILCKKAGKFKRPNILQDNRSGLINKLVLAQKDYLWEKLRAQPPHAMYDPGLDVGLNMLGKYEYHLSIKMIKYVLNERTDHRLKKAGDKGVLVNINIQYYTYVSTCPPSINLKAFFKETFLNFWVHTYGFCISFFLQQNNKTKFQTFISEIFS